MRLISKIIAIIILQLNIFMVAAQDYISTDSLLQKELEAGVLLDTTIFDQIRYYQYKAIEALEHNNATEACDNLLKSIELNYDSITQKALYPKTFAASNYLMYKAANTYYAALYFLPYAIKYDPDNRHYMSELAWIYYSLKDNIPPHSNKKLFKGNSTDLYKILVKKYPTNSQYVNGLALSYLLHNQYSKSIKQVERYMELEGEDIGMTGMKCELLHRLKKNKKAISTMRKYVITSPQEEISGMLIVGKLVEDSALQYNILKELEGKYPNDAYVNIALGKYYKEHNNIPLFRKYTQIGVLTGDLEEEDAATTARPLIGYLLDEQRVSEACALLDTLSARYPNSMAVKRLTYDVAKQLNVKRVMIDILSEIVENDSTNEAAYTDLYIQYMESQDSIKSYEMALQGYKRYKNDYWKTMYALSLLWYDKADKNFSNVIEVVGQISNYERKSMMYNNITLYSALDSTLHDLTIALFDSVLYYTPNYSMGLNNYAYYLATHGGDLIKAEKMATKALEMQPNDPTVVDTYAWIMHLQGNDFLAELHFERIMHDMEHVDLIYHHFIVAENLNKTNILKQLYDKALAIKQSGKKIDEKDIEMLDYIIEHNPN